MPKGYLVANIRVKDKEKFVAFSGMAGPVNKAHGGKLAKGPDAERHEGDLKGTVVMIEFDTLNAARQFYQSDEYQAAKVIKDACSEADLMLIEGTE